MNLSESVKVKKIRVSNRKMNKILKESGINFKKLKTINSIVLERKNNKYF